MITGHYLYECLKKYSRFQIIHMVAKRVAELQNGARPLVISKYTSPVEIALQEIAEGKIFAASRRPEALEKLETKDANQDMDEELEEESDEDEAEEEE